MNTFNFIPSYATSADWEPTLLKNQFGDSYEQKAPDGIQNNRLKFNLVFEKIADLETQQAVAFIMATGGITPFFWTPPAPYDDGTGTMMWTCEKAQDTFNEWNSRTITFPFVQTFNPEE